MRKPGVKRVVTIVLSIVVVLLVVVAVVAAFFLGPAIKAAVEGIGPKVTQTEITVDGVRASLFSGEAQVNGFILGNPEGFKTDHAMKVDRIKLRIQPASVFSDTVVVEEFIIEGAEITLELAPGGSNLAQIQANAKAFAPSGGTSKEGGAPKKGDEKKVIIRHLSVTGGTVRISTPLLGGAAVPIPLPALEMTGIGEKSGGVGMAEAAAMIVVDLAKSVFKAAKESGKLIGKGAKWLEHNVGDAVEKLKGATEDGLEKVKGLL